MCRHLAYTGRPSTLADLITGPAHGLYEQSWAPRRQRHGTVNADGFGFGWYPESGGGPPARYRRSVPVWADPNLPDLLGALRSRTVLAAVRDATAGTTQDESAAAPYRADGRLFSHNGAVHDWQRLPGDLELRPEAEELLSLESRCDSALVWAMLLRRLRAGRPPADAMAELVRQIRSVRPGARLNFLLTEGRTVTATRCGDTLWYREADGGAVVASEPDARDGWHEVPDNSVLLAGPGGVRTVPLSTAPDAPASPYPAGHVSAPVPTSASVSERNPIR